MNTLLAVAFSYLNKPYIFGGQNFEGVDCSGFVQLVLQSAGVCPPVDLNAQALHEHFKDRAAARDVSYVEGRDYRGYLLFFGKSLDHITHVAMGVDGFRMIEAGGGDGETRTRTDAAKRNACVRVRPIQSRRDLVAILRPQYSRWIK